MWWRRGARANGRTHPEEAEEDEGNELDEVPRIVVLDVEHHEVVVTERVEGAEDEGGRQRAEEGPPERLQREVVAHLDRGRRAGRDTGGVICRGHMQTVGHKMVGYGMKLRSIERLIMQLQ